MKFSETKKKKYDYIGYCWILTGILGMALFCYYPAALSVVYSFTDWSPRGARFIDVQNFVEIFSDAVFWICMKNMAIMIFFSLILSNVATIAFAEMLFNMKSERVSAIYRFVFMLPVLVPGMVTMLIWQSVIFSPEPSGLMNTLLSALGAQPLKWYYAKDTALMSMILTGFPWVGGTAFLIYLAALQNMPDSVIDASRLDGLSTWKRVFAMDIHFLKGQIKYFVIMGIIGGLQAFDFQLMFTLGGPDNATNVLGFYMYWNGINYFRYGYGAAVGMVMFVIALACTILNFRMLRKKEDE